MLAGDDSAARVAANRLRVGWFDWIGEPHGASILRVRQLCVVLGAGGSNLTNGPLAWRCCLGLRVEVPAICNKAPAPPLGAPPSPNPPPPYKFCRCRKIRGCRRFLGCVPPRRLLVFLSYRGMMHWYLGYTGYV